MDQYQIPPRRILIAAAEFTGFDRFAAAVAGNESGEAPSINAAAAASN